MPLRSGRVASSFSTQAFVANDGVHHTLAVRAIRAFTARSQFSPFFGLRMFSNRYMQSAVGLSLVLLPLIVPVPILSAVFDTTPISLHDWAEMLPLILLPSAAAELTKSFMLVRSSAPAGS